MCAIHTRGGGRVLRPRTAADSRIRGLVVSVTGSTSTTTSRIPHPCCSSVFRKPNRFRQTLIGFLPPVQEPRRHQKIPHTRPSWGPIFTGFQDDSTAELVRTTHALCECRGFRLVLVVLCGTTLRLTVRECEGLLAGRTAFQSRSENAATDDGRNRIRLFWASKQTF